MRKYLLSISALVIAFGLSAFTNSNNKQTKGYFTRYWVNVGYYYVEYSFGTPSEGNCVGYTFDKCIIKAEAQPTIPSVFPVYSRNCYDTQDVSYSDGYYFIE